MEAGTPEMTPLLTICVLTYNRPEFLGDSISSVLAQTYGEFRLVVLDDASSSDYRSVIGQFNDPRVLYVRNAEHSGLVGNFAEAIHSFSHSKYMMIFHDDDCMHPRLVEYEIKALRSDDELAFVASGYSSFSGNAPVFSTNITGHFKVFQNISELTLSLIKGERLHHCSAMYRSDLLKQKDPRVVAKRFASVIWDRPYFLEVARGYRCALIPEPLVMARKHPKQVSKSMDVSEDNLIELYTRYREALGPLWSKESERLFFRHTGYALPLMHQLWLSDDKGSLVSFLARCRDMDLFRYPYLAYLPLRIVEVLKSKIFGFRQRPSRKLPS